MCCITLFISLICLVWSVDWFGLFNVCSYVCAFVSWCFNVYLANFAGLFGLACESACYLFELACFGGWVCLRKVCLILVFDCL